MYTMKRRPPDETKETTGKFVFPSVLRHFRLHHKISGKILTIKHSTKNVYTTKYQREATSYLTKWKKGKRTLDAPLLVKIHMAH